MDVVREVLFQPMSALGVSHRVRGEDAHVGERCAGGSNEAEAHRHLILPDDSQAGQFGESILGGADTTFDAVFHGDLGVGAAPTHHVI